MKTGSKDSDLHEMAIQIIMCTIPSLSIFILTIASFIYERTGMVQLKLSILSVPDFSSKNISLKEKFLTGVA